MKKRVFLFGLALLAGTHASASPSGAIRLTQDGPAHWSGTTVSFDVETSFEVLFTFRIVPAFFPDTGTLWTVTSSPATLPAGNGILSLSVDAENYPIEQVYAAGGFGLSGLHLARCWVDITPVGPLPPPSEPCPMGPGLYHHIRLYLSAGGYGGEWWVPDPWPLVPGPNGQQVFQTLDIIAAPILFDCPAIPVPAAGLLAVAGAGLIGELRRRQLL